MTLDDALAALRAAADPDKAPGMAAYHKVPRPYLGTPNPALDELAKTWRRSLDLETRLSLAAGLWGTNIHEARICAAKLLTQARIRPDTEVWRLITSWVPEFDAWAVADHACMAGHRRIMADLARMDVVAPWTESNHLWTKRAALVITLPLARLPHPKPHEVAAREQVLDWAAGYVADKEWFIQKAVAWWLRDLSKHDAKRVQAFLEIHGPEMKAFARREASKYLPKPG